MCFNGYSCECDFERLYIRQVHAYTSMGFNSTPIAVHGIHARWRWFFYVTFNEFSTKQSFCTRNTNKWYMSGVVVLFISLIEKYLVLFFPAAVSICFFNFTASLLRRMRAWFHITRLSFRRTHDGSANFISFFAAAKRGRNKVKRVQMKCNGEYSKNV